jgi:OMF family outer membrane factor
MLSQTTTTIIKVEELYDLFSSQNLGIKNLDEKEKLAKIVRNTAFLQAFNPRINLQAQAIDNLSLPLSFIPAQVFGGNPGEFRQVAIGQQYVSSLAVVPQFDILNLAQIAEIKSLKKQSELAQGESKIYLYERFLQINSLYHSILSLQIQQKLLDSSLSCAQTIFTTAQNKFEEGVISKIDLNEAQSQLILIEDKLSQVKLAIREQKDNLQNYFHQKFLFDLKENTTTISTEYKSEAASDFDLYARQALLQSEIAANAGKSASLQYLPVLSFVSSLNWQNLSNQAFFATNANTQQFSYLGIRLNWDLPSVAKFTSIQSKKIEAQIAKNQSDIKLAEIKTQNQLLPIQIQTAQTQYQNTTKISSLKKENFEKKMMQYQEGILSVQKLIEAQNELISAQINANTANYNTLFLIEKSKIQQKF